MTRANSKRRAVVAPPEEWRTQRGRYGADDASEVQRRRILSAMAAAVAEYGVESATVARVITVARVSRRTFYDLFDNRSDCLLAALEQGVALAGERAQRASAAESGWVDRIRAGLFALLEFFDEEPQLAQLCIVHSMSATPAAVNRRLQVLEMLAEVVDAGREHARHQPPPLISEAVVGGALGVVQARLLKPESGRLIGLLNPLMSFIVLPYRGGGAAHRQLQRQLPARPAPSRHNARSASPPGAEIRMTYRTMRVLAAIAAHPGINNTETSEHAGITDQGQMSKLLSRLQRIELIENKGLGQVGGVANAWQLTPRGEDLERIVSRELVDARG